MATDSYFPLLVWVVDATQFRLIETPTELGSYTIQVIQTNATEKDLETAEKAYNIGAKK